jgi:hypothetical protein
MNCMVECWTKKTTEILGLIWVKLRTEYPHKYQEEEKAAASLSPLGVRLANPKAFLRDYKQGRASSNNL